MLVRKSSYAKSSYGRKFVRYNFVMAKVVSEKDRSKQGSYAKVSYGIKIAQGKVRKDEYSLAKKIVTDNDRMPKDRMG